MKCFVLIVPHDTRLPSEVIALGGGCVSPSEAAERWAQQRMRLRPDRGLPAMTWQAHEGDWGSALIGLHRLEQTTGRSKGSRA